MKALSENPFFSAVQSEMMIRKANKQQREEVDDEASMRFEQISGASPECLLIEAEIQKRIPPNDEKQSVCASN